MHACSRLEIIACEFYDRIDQWVILVLFCARNGKWQIMGAELLQMLYEARSSMSVILCCIVLNSEFRGSIVFVTPGSVAVRQAAS
eukprot:scaffold190069_cov28-Prasinocladus_malaysianus.AAC.1